MQIPNYLLPDCRSGRAILDYKSEVSVIASNKYQIVEGKLCLLVIISCLLLSCNNAELSRANQNKDDYYEKCRKLVLSERQTGKEYFFSRENRGVDEISVTYLGDVITAKKDTLHILNSINFSGLREDSKRGSGRVFIYTPQGKRMGYYYVGGAEDVPSKVEDGTLIFRYENQSCDESTVINLKDSIPNQIFVNCTAEGGDLYTFSSGTDD